jgi:glycosyltransferase involved in cell wall biosynthesis
MTTPRISLCIISRKEDEDSLKKALDSCAGHVIEINVIDTSKEGSIRLIDSNDLRYSNKDGWTIYKSTTTGLIANCRIIPFKWTNDFAAARNFSFEQATGDVIFWIDSDDTVLHPEKACPAKS